MNIQKVIDGMNQLYAQGEGDKVEDYLSSNLEQALQEHDTGCAITIINELIGYYRDTSQYDKAEAYCGKLLPFMEKTGLAGTVHYGTSCLNIANAYRASGRLEDSLSYYQKTFEIYDEVLDKKDIRYASLYNNLSLLYQEMGRFSDASQALLSALQIIKEYPEAVVEQGVTYANLATSYVREGEIAKAKEAAECSLLVFHDNDLRENYHYSIALSVAGDVAFVEEDYEQAAAYYEHAMMVLKCHVGITHAYLRVLSNLQTAYEKAGKQDALHGLKLASDYYEENQKGFHDHFLAAISEQSNFEKECACKDAQTASGKADEDDQVHAASGKADEDICSKFTIGKLGEGSECFGYDDIVSKDHDFGPGFGIYVTREQYASYGKALEQAYDSLPVQFRGLTRPQQIKGAQRNGVIIMEDFFGRILGLQEDEISFLMQKHTLPEGTWLRVEDWQLKTVTNGEIFVGEENVFGSIYHNLKKGYPENILRRKLAQALGTICQTGQYNYQRMMKRDDLYSGILMLHSFEEEVLTFLFLINRVYAPHAKWRMREAATLTKGQSILTELKELMTMQPDITSYRKRETVEWFGKENSEDVILEKIDNIAKGIVNLLKEEKLTDTDAVYLEEHIPYLFRN